MEFNALIRPYEMGRKLFPGARGRKLALILKLVIWRSTTESTLVGTQRRCQSKQTWPVLLVVVHNPTKLKLEAIHHVTLEPYVCMITGSKVQKFMYPGSRKFVQTFNVTNSPNQKIVTMNLF